MLTKEQFEAKFQKDRKEGFDNWIARSETRILLSLLGPSEHTEAVLRTAYEAGFSFGQATALIEVITSAIEHPRR